MTASVAIVTGATGFLGRWSVRGLLQRGFIVHALGAPTDTRAPAEAEGAIFHRVNLLDSAEVVRVTKEIRPSHLIHFAWNATPGEYWTSPDNYTWSAATLHLVRTFRETGGTRFIGAGSCAEYDWSRADICEEDVTPLVLESAKPATPYATCKAALGKVMASYAATDDFSFAWGRIFFQYGPYEYPNRLVPSVIRALLEGRKAECSHGRQRRSFLSSIDVGDAFAALADSHVQGAVNIADSRELTIGELVTTIGRLMQRPELIVLNARIAASNEPDVLIAALARLTEQVGWTPRETLESGLEKTIAWWRNNR
jgi:nucleoside-diphosphate-sugar epimerase